MKKTEPPSDDEFNGLLRWLDPNPERAAEKYEEIHRKVVKILVRRQCHEAEEVWDETVNRVSHRVPTIAETWVGDPALYFYAVMRLAHLEWLRHEQWKRDRLNDMAPPPPTRSDDIERLHKCLDNCLDKLGDEDRRLILEYFDKEKREKIEHRRAMAEAQGITLNTQRMRVHRINADLEKCIVACLDDHEGS